jgi:catechol 2,3-dioxygenase-like lactoylglutathione lyase family enzyme
MEDAMHRLEHANLSVRDAAAIVAFLGVAFPDFRIRGKGLDDAGRPWCHFGDDEVYLALTSLGEGSQRTPYGATPGLNHVGFEVDDIDALRRRMEAAGYRHNLAFDDHPARRRIYYFDPEGNDWEFVQYLTDDRRQRNDYGVV